jgi:glycerate-2-kinase
MTKFRTGRIKNFDELATTQNRKMALGLIEAGLEAINTQEVIKNKIKLENNILLISGESFDLNKFKNIKVVGFGKSSLEAALALEEILGSRISSGAVVGLEKVDLKYVETFAGTHPRPSEVNIPAGKKIYEIIKDSSEEDLIIVLVSGGGSALLCYQESECVQGLALYDSFLKSGKTIAEINTVRKHLSLLKGGGLAKVAYPATVIGLIFSDVPGDSFENVASGPTYKDTTTIADAKKIVDENNLGEFELTETPKEDKYFEKVYNFVLVSNKTAVEAMAKKAQEFNLEANIISTELYDEVGEAIKKIFSLKNKTNEAFSQVLGSPGPYPGQTIQKRFIGFINLAAGEPSIVVPKNGGQGGRNLHMGLEAINNKIINDDSVFISFASDGMDNSDVAGAIVDKSVIEKAEKLGLSAEDYLARFDSYNFFQKTGDTIITGRTGANVADLMILLTKK